MDLYDNDDEVEILPGHSLAKLLIPMLCPECDTIHPVPVEFNAIPKVGGLPAMILKFQQIMVEKGWRIPVKADFEAFADKLTKLEAEEAEMDKATEEAKARGAVYIPRTSREGGDA